MGGLEVTRILARFAVVLSLFTTPARACLWDEDTLIDEQRGLPEVAAILAGKWERHSLFFYEQRVAAMTVLLAAEPNNLDAYDNLAVAYDKLGDSRKAIGIILKKDAIKPGEYKTLANLGTFYLHAGDVEPGIAYIKKALAVNPDAHFGREKYQLMIAEFLRDAKARPEMLDYGSFLLPELNPQWHANYGPTAGTADGKGSIGERLPINVSLGRVKDKPKVDKGIIGVVGIIRFGSANNPHLFMALGDLLAARGDPYLAYRAYRRSFDYGHPRPEMAKRRMEEMRSRSEDKSGFDDATIDRERAEGEAWTVAYQAFEDDLVRAGKDTQDQANYKAFYDSHGSPRDKPSALAAGWAKATKGGPKSPAAIAIAVVLVLFFASRLSAYRKKRRDTATGVNQV